MKIISHRRNSISELIQTPTNFGVEVDIRSFKNKLIIHHDPFVEGEDFERWLEHYHHSTLILNVKEEGLEDRLIFLMKKFNIDDFFFLDQSFPFLIKYSKRGEKRCAVRVSEFESIETALSLSGIIDWVWIDCFSHFSLSATEIKKLKDSKFDLCLVSPELQGRDPDTEIPALRLHLKIEGIPIDAVCTKKPDMWMKEVD